MEEEEDEKEEDKGKRSMRTRRRGERIREGLVGLKEVTK